MRIVAGRFKGRGVEVPGGARPGGARLRTSLLDALASQLAGARVLDLCAGAGGFGLEALSRGARSVVLVDASRDACAALRAFLVKVGAEASEAQVVRADVLDEPLPEGPFDLVFLDPPFAWWSGEEAGRLLHRAVGRLAVVGRLAIKLPARAALPPGSGVSEQRRKRIGDAAWVLAVGADSAQDVK